MMASMAVKFLVCSLVCACILAPVSSQDDFIKDCQTQKMDVVFVQDASFSVGADSFQMAKIFIIDIVRQLSIGHDLVRVALVRFGTYVDIIAKLSESSDVSTVSDAIAGMEYKSGGTQTGKALKAVREKVLNERRENANAVVVIITDGASISFRETRRESMKLRDKDVRLVWLYVNADDTDSNEVRRERNFMIREGDDTFGASSFQDLDKDDRMQILQASCKEDPVLEITTEDVPTTLPVTTAPTTILPTTQAPLTTVSQSPVTTTSTTTVPNTTTATITTAPTTTLPTTQAPLTTVSESSITTTATATATTTTAATTLPTTTVVITTQVVTSDLLPMSASPKPSPTSTVHADVDTTITAESVTTSAVDHGESSSSAPSSTPPPDVSPAEAISTSPRLTTPKPSLSTSVVTKAPEDKGNLQGSDAENGASQTGNWAHGEEEEGGWENSWENIVGVTVGVFAVAAVSTGLLYLLWRRRKEKRRKVKISQPQDQNGAKV